MSLNRLENQDITQILVVLYLKLFVGQPFDIVEVKIEHLLACCYSHFITSYDRRNFDLVARNDIASGLLRNVEDFSTPTLADRPFLFMFFQHGNQFPLLPYTTGIVVQNISI